MHLAWGNNSCIPSLEKWNYETQSLALPQDYAIQNNLVTHVLNFFYYKLFPRQVESWRATCWRTTGSRPPSKSCRAGSGTSRAASTRPFRYVVIWLNISYLSIQFFKIVSSAGRSVRRDVLVFYAINTIKQTRRDGPNESNFAISRRDSKHNYSTRFPDFEPCSVTNISICHQHFKLMDFSFSLYQIPISKFIICNVQDVWINSTKSSYYLMHGNWSQAVADSV